MKKLLLLTIPFLVLISLSTAQNVNIPDANFLAALIEQGVDTNEDAQISFEEAEAMISIDVSEKGITDMTGIEAFTNLDTLLCKENSLTSLDVSNNIALKVFNCQNNELISLDISSNTSLLYFDCGNNLIESLDVSNNTLLKGLWCENNSLNTINVSNNPDLELFWPADNNLTSLDLSNNMALLNLNSSFMPLDTLDVSANTALIFLVCVDNQLNGLDLSNNHELETLYCQENMFSQLDIRENTALELLNISDMSTLYEVCVWETWTTDSVNIDINTDDSPNVCFDTICDGVCGEITATEEPLNHGFNIYPNPTYKLLTIESGVPGTYSFEILSLSGQLMHTSTGQGTSHRIDVGMLPKGMYILTIRTKGETIHRRIIKQ